MLKWITRYYARYKTKKNPHKLLKIGKWWWMYTPGEKVQNKKEVHQEP